MKVKTQASALMKVQLLVDNTIYLVYTIHSDGVVTLCGPISGLDWIFKLIVFHWHLELNTLCLWWSTLEHDLSLRLETESVRAFSQFGVTELATSDHYHHHLHTQVYIHNTFSAYSKQ